MQILNAQLTCQLQVRLCSIVAHSSNVAQEGPSPVTALVFSCHATILLSIMLSLRSLASAIAAALSNL